MDNELKDLRVGTIVLAPGESHTLETGTREMAFALVRGDSDAGTVDQAFSPKTNNALYMAAGYHRTACGPGATLYHLTFMAGPHRMSKSRVHDDFRFLLDENSMENPYATQSVKAPPA